MTTAHGGKHGGRRHENRVFDSDNGGMAVHGGTFGLSTREIRYREINPKQAPCAAMPPCARQFIVTLEPPAGDSDSEAVQRLRRFLKRAWRAYGLKCRDIRENQTTITKPKGEPSC